MNKEKKKQQDTTALNEQLLQSLHGANLKVGHLEKTVGEQAERLDVKCKKDQDPSSSGEASVGYCRREDVRNTKVCSASSDSTHR